MATQKKLKVAVETPAACAAREVERAPDLREIELREGVRMAERAGMKNQVELYRGKLKEHLESVEPGLYVKREADLLGSEFFKTFPLLTVITWTFESPALETQADVGAALGRPHGQRMQAVRVAATTDTHYGFKVEIAPGVYIYYPFVSDGRMGVRLAGSSEEFVDYRGRMIPVAGLELATKARESGWFSRIQVLDPLDITKHIEEVDKSRAAELENYKQMLEHDPLVFGVGIDKLPRQIYHWIGQDEQALSKEEIAKQIQGLEGFANGK